MNKLMLGAVVAAFLPVFANASEVVVKMKERFGVMALSTVNVKVMREIRGSKDTYLVEGDLETLKLSPYVEYAEANRILHLLDAEPAEPDAKAWGLAKIHATEAWKLATGAGVVVAVIDTGADYNHPALKDKMWVNEKECAPGADPTKDNDGNGYIGDCHGYNFNAKTGDPMDDNEHGTHTSGTIAGDKVGVAPGAKIMAVKFLSAEGSGTLADAVEAINYAHKMGAKIMSNSWGGGGFDQSMYDAIKSAQDDGVLFIAAAGNEYNDNDASPTYPATYQLDSVISVAATDTKDKKADFSNWGKMKVHVAAPGVNVYSLKPGGGYQTMSGTSMACPHVAGVAALMLSKGIAAKDLKELLIRSSDKVAALKDKSVSNGRVNALSALK